MGVSIIIAAYNCKQYLDECLNSVFHQTYQGDLEIIVCDDCSSDGTSDLLQKYADEGHIVFLKNEMNFGAAQSRNNCINVAKYDYLAILDADDYISNDRIQKQVDVLDKNPSIDFVSTGIQWFYDDGERVDIIPKKEYPDAKDFLLRMPFAHATTMFRKSILEKVQGYTVSKETRRSEDYDLFMKIYAAGGKGCNIKDITYFYRRFRKFDKNKESYSHRIDEAKTKAKGFKAMGIGPVRYLYVVKPLVLGLLPKRFIDAIWHKG